MRLALILLMMLVLFLTGPVMQLAIAAPSAAPSVSSKIKGDYARLTFSWPEAVKFRTSTVGNTLRITFDKPLTASPSGALAGLAPYVQKGSLSADKRTLSLSLNKPYKTRSFVSGNAGGVDLMQISAKPAAAPAAKPTPAPKQIAAKAPAPLHAPKPLLPEIKKPVAKIAPPKKPAPTAPVLAKKPEPKPAIPFKQVAAKEEAKLAEKTAAPATPKLAEKIAEKVAEKLPEASKPETPIAKEEKPAPQKKDVVEAKTEPVVEAKEEAKKEEKPEPAPEASIKDSFPVPMAKPTPPAPPAPKEIVAATLAKGKQMPVTVHQQNVNSDFYFPWKERTASAVFVRGNYVWIVFDKPAEFNLASLGSILPKFISKVEGMEYPGHTVLRLTATSPVSASARHRRNTYEWIISVSRRKSVPAFPIITETSTKPPLKPFVAINLLQTTPSILITDPVLGDTLEVIPTHEEGRGMIPERDFVGFSLLRTAQGVVVKKLDDAIRVVKQRNGLRVMKSGTGIALSPDLPTFDMAAFMETEATANTFFPYNRWQTKDAEDFYKRKHDIQNEITSANDQKASFLRTKLAELYLGAGLNSEALGVLNQIKTLDPDYYSVYQIAALRGATNFMMDRIGEAALDFADPSLEGEDEISYWKRYIDVMQGDEKKLTKFLAYDPQYSSHYPPKMRQKLAIIASDQLIGRKRYNAFNAVMNALKKSDQLDGIKDQSDYMVGRVLADAGKSADAIALFKKLIDSTTNRFVQVRAEFALATLEYESGAIDRLELINRLDRLRYVWRGDSLELGVLNLLGDLNALEGRYAAALRAWKDIITNFPQSPLALQVTEKSADAFVQLFNNDKADTMEPLEALALYYEFRDLTPIGKEGDKMIQKLADRLASVDLLDRAAALLSHQVQFRLEKEERSRVGSRLGLIYLLNREPKKTLEALELTGYGAGGDDLNRQRNQLAAIAYSDIGDSKTALDMLKDDYSVEGKMIRLDVFWKDKDWKNVTSTAEDILASRKDLTAPLTDGEAQTLLRLAVAYTFAGDTVQLQYLRDYFTPLMDKNPLKDTFLFISNDTGPIDPKNMGRLEKEISGIKSFLDTYRSQVQEKGLSSIN